MDSYADLFEKGEYDLLIDMLKKAEDPTSRLYLSLAYSAKGQFIDALPVLLNSKKEIYQAHPVQFIKALMQLRVALGQFDEAYEDISWLDEQSYISQEVEEELRGLKQAIRAAEISSYKDFSCSKEELHNMLTKPKDNFELLSALSSLNKIKIEGFIPDLISICSSNHPHDCRVYALLLLVADKYTGPIDFNDGKQVMIINPSKLIPPFTNEPYLTTKALLDTYKDPSLGRLAIDLLDEVIISCYPKQIPEKDKEASYAVALLQLATEYLGQKEETDLNSLLNADKEVTSQVKEELDSLLTPAID